MCAAIYYLETGSDDLEVDEDLSYEEQQEELFNRLMEKISGGTFPPNGVTIKKGDVIALAPDMYRNEYKAIWNGSDITNASPTSWTDSDLVALDDTMDEYGHVPAGFWVPDVYPKDYWQEVISHNNLVPMPLDIERKRSLTSSLTLVSQDDDGVIYKSSFMFRDVTYNIYYQCSTMDSEELHAHITAMIEDNDQIFVEHYNDIAEEIANADLTTDFFREL